MKKIAILVKGQSRNAKEFSEFIEKFYKQRHPTYDFRVFVSTWRTLPGDHPEVVGQFNAKVHDERIIASMWKSVNPEAVIINQEILLYHTICSIMKHNMKDDEFINFSKKLYDKTTYNIPEFRHLITPSPEVMDRDNIYHKDVCLSLIHKLGQFFSMASGIDYIKQYVEVTDWTPDIVWVTRSDWVGYHPEDFWEGQHYADDIIYTDFTGIIKGYPFSNDLNFYMSYNTAINHVSELMRRFYIACVERKYDFLVVPMSGIHCSHVLWSVIMNECNFVSSDIPVYGTLRRDNEQTKKTVDDFLNDRDFIKFKRAYERITLLDKNYIYNPERINAIWKEFEL